MLVFRRFSSYLLGTARDAIPIHGVAADGLFRPNAVFHVAPWADIKPVEELFRATY